MKSTAGSILKEARWIVCLKKTLPSACSASVCQWYLGTEKGYPGGDQCVGLKS